MILTSKTGKLFLIAALLVLGGCASSGKRSVTTIEAPSKFILEKVVGEAASYTDQIIKPLIKRGFTASLTTDPNALHVIIDLNPNVFHTKFTVTIFQQGKELIRAEASNSGWGTGIARSSALNNLAEDIANRLDEQIAQIQLSRTSTSNVTLAVCEDLYRDKRLAVLRGKIELHPEAGKLDIRALTNKDKPSAEDKEALLFLGQISQECLKRSVSSLMSGSTDNRLVDIQIAKFNKSQFALAELLNGELTYGEFAKAQAEIEQSVLSETSRLQTEIDNALRAEATKGSNKTANTQSAFGNMLSTIPQPAIKQPTYTTCNRIGNTLSCNSY